MKQSAAMGPSCSAQNVEDLDLHPHCRWKCSQVRSGSAGSQAPPVGRWLQEHRGQGSGLRGRRQGRAWGVSLEAVSHSSELCHLLRSSRLSMEGPASPAPAPGALPYHVAFSQLLGLTVVATTGAWLGVYRGGIAWESALQFNVHPLCMIIGLVFLQGDGESLADTTWERV